MAQHLTALGFDALGGTDVATGTYVAAPPSVHACYNNSIYNNLSYSGASFTSTTKSGGTFTTFGGLITLQAMIYGVIQNITASLNCFTWGTNPSFSLTASDNLSTTDSATGIVMKRVIPPKLYPFPLHLQPEIMAAFMHKPGKPVQLRSASETLGASDAATKNTSLHYTASDLLSGVDSATGNFLSLPHAIQPTPIPPELIVPNIDLWNYVTLRPRSVPFNTTTYDNVVIADAPVGYWKLNESKGANGSVAIDSVGNNNGTYQGTTIGFGRLPAPSGIGDVAAFLNTTLTNTDNIGIPSSGGVVNTNLNSALQLHDFTIETWVYPVGTTQCGFFAAGTVISNDTEIFITLASGGAGKSNNQLRFTLSNEIFTTNIFVPTGTWSHIIFTYSNSSKLITAYFNGVASPVTFTTTANININNNSWIIGMDGNTRFLGGLSRFAIYNYVLSQAQITNHYNIGAPATTLGAIQPQPLAPSLILGMDDAMIYLTPRTVTDKSYENMIILDNPVGFWPMTETSGSTFADNSPYSHSLNRNTVSGTINPPAGMTGVAPGYNVLGSGGQLTSGNISNGNQLLLNAFQNHDFTVEFWTQMISSPSQNTTGIFQAGTASATDQGFEIWADTSTAAPWVIHIDFGNDNWITPFSMAATTWYHIVFTFSQSTLLGTLYINGTSNGTNTFAGALNITGSSSLAFANSFVGIVGSGGANFQGRGYFTRGAVYNYILSSTQVSNHYTRGTTAIP